jgi:hypothetical protein
VERAGSLLYFQLLGKLRWGRLQFKGNPREMFTRPPSQPIGGHSGVFLSSQNAQKSGIERIMVLG